MLINPVFSRDSIASIFIGNCIADVNNSIYRFQQGKFNSALVMEGSSTNLLYNSSFEYDTTDWSRTSTGVTTSVTTSVTFHRDNAVCLTTGSSEEKLYQAQTLTSTTYTLSAYVRVNSGLIPSATVCSLYAAKTTGDTVLTTTYHYEGNYWYRLSASFTGDANTWYSGISVNSGNTVYVDAIQLEAKPFSSSYIYTVSGATQTRNAELLSYALSATTFSIITKDAGSLSVWVKPFFDYTVSGTGTYTIIQVGSGSTTSYKIIYDSSGDTFSFVCKNSTSATKSFNFNGVNFIHVCATWSGTTSSIYVNGEKGTDDSSFSVLSTEPVYLYVGSDDDGSNPFYGLMDDIAVL